MNPNAAGHFLGAFTAKATDRDIVSNNLKAIGKAKEKLSQEENEIREHEVKITDDRGNVRLRHDKYAHMVNERLLTDLLKLRAEILTVEQKLDDVYKELSQTFCQNLAGTSKARRQKENQRKLRARKKKVLFEKNVLTGLYEEYGEALVCVTLIRLDHLKLLTEDERETLLAMWGRFDTTAQTVMANTITKEMEKE
jgi:hypothetical protein